MIHSFYDVVFLGTRFEALLSGALLAKRGFRVLLLGQGELPPTYELAGHTLLRSPFAFLAAQSPVARRSLAELALHQVFRRRAVSMDPSFQIVLPGHRIDIPPTQSYLEREIERELADVRRAVDDLHREVERSSESLDALTQRDLLWPPETFMERREFARTAGPLGLDRRGPEPDPFADFPDSHAFRHVVRAPAFFASGMDPKQLGALSTLRLYDAWRRSSACLDGGYAWLRQALIEKIETYSGEVRPRERGDAIVLKRNAASGVRLASSGETVGCSFVVGACPLDALLQILPDRGAMREMFERVGEPSPRWFRYTLNVVVDAHAVPAGMARDVFYLRRPRRPYSAENLIRIEAHDEVDGARLLCVEVLLPRRGVEEIEGYLSDMRERILSGLDEIMPFAREHLRLVDSPHDGREAMDMRTGRAIAPDEPWTRGPTTMEPIYGYPVRGTLGVCALPVRTSIKRLLLCNGQVVPGLGTEGAFLSAWSTARIVTRSDKKREWMRRGLWTKLDV